MSLLTFIARLSAWHLAPRRSGASWITGFCEGRAAFTYSTMGGGKIMPCFSVRCRRENEDLLRLLQSFFNAGSIYACGPTSYFRVHKRDEVRRIASHFQLCPLRSARRTAIFGAWTELVDACARRESAESVRLLAEKLSSLQLRQRGTRKHPLCQSGNAAA
jgi:hypothetical protein